MKAKHVPAADVILLKHHLTALHLPTLKSECEQVARQCATENIDYLGFLLRLCERELADREQRSYQRRLKAAGLPKVKTLDTFDFTAQPSLNRALILELSRCEFIDRRLPTVSIWSSTMSLPARRSSGRRRPSTGPAEVAPSG